MGGGVNYLSTAFVKSATFTCRWPSVGVQSNVEDSMNAADHKSLSTSNPPEGQPKNKMAAAKWETSMFHDAQVMYVFWNMEECIDSYVTSSRLQGSVTTYRQKYSVAADSAITDTGTLFQNVRRIILNLSICQRPSSAQCRHDSKYPLLRIFKILCYLKECV